MATQQYDPVGAMGGLFAPAYIHGDPVSEAAVAAWNAAHLKLRPTTDPKFSTDAPKSPVEAQRDAIVAQLLGGDSSL